MDSLLNILIEQLNGSILVLVVVLIACFFLIYRVGKWSETFSNHKRRISDLEGIRDVVLKLETKVDLIYQNTNPNALVKAQSPISLTEKGKEIMVELSADHLFDRYAKRLVKVVENTAPKNAYDIQQSSFRVVKNEFPGMLNEEDLAAIKKTAFNNGLILEDIMTIFGVLLRNKVLTKRNIPIADVDKFNVSSSD